MIDDNEKRLIAAGVQEAIRTLYNDFHLENDCGHDLRKWLKRYQDKIVQTACDKIEKERAEQKVELIHTPSQFQLHLCDCACHQFHIENSCLDCHCGSD
jgi:hypothetical protein